MIEKLLIAALLFWFFDTVTGVVIAKFIENNFKSSILKKSLLVKGCEFLLAIIFTFSNELLLSIGYDIPIAQFSITMFIFQEVSSLIENYNRIKKEVSND